MARFRLWRFRRRYRRNLAQLAAEGQAQWAADLDAAVDKFRATVGRVTQEDWQATTRPVRRWH